MCVPPGNNAWLWSNKHVSSVSQHSCHHQPFRLILLAPRFRLCSIIRRLNYVSKRFSCLFAQNKPRVGTVAATTGSEKSYPFGRVKSQLRVWYLLAVLQSACRLLSRPVHMKTMFQVLVHCFAYAVTCDGRLVPDVRRQWQRTFFFCGSAPRLKVTSFVPQ